jgi:hypothetical protein
MPQLYRKAEDNAPAPKSKMKFDGFGSESKVDVTTLPPSLSNSPAPTTSVHVLALTHIPL